jgi:para-nitrobenzyl esterase
MQRLLLAAAITLPCATHALATTPVFPTPDLRTLTPTTSGPITGTTAHGITAFRGIPYAAPPIGDLRWRPPVAPAPWTKPRPATGFGNFCPQNEGHDWFATGGGAEDCLTLNVFTQTAPHATKLPVMVWIHGGNLEEGRGDDYDPTGLITQGHVVVVTLNYRLGVLGFLAHPALDAEHHTLADYGLMDQQFALAWVQHNIAGFGGDPARVTIFGESAGGLSVYANMASPAAKPLFARAIVQSGGYEPAVPSLADAESKGRAFATAAGCPDPSAACLRHLPLARILAAEDGHETGLIVDGTILPRSLDAAFSTGQFNHVPVISGTNADEASLFLVYSEHTFGTPPNAADYDTLIKSFYAKNAAAVRAAYPLSPGQSPAAVLNAAATASIMDCPGHRLQQSLSRFTPLYAYEFADRTAPSYLPPVGFDLGAAHTFELSYLFTDYHGATGTLHALTPAQRRLSTTMIHAWTQFAHTGTPGWPRFTPGQQQVLSLQLGTPTIITTYGEAHKCGFWDKQGT